MPTWLTLLAVIGNREKPLNISDIRQAHRLRHNCDCIAKDYSVRVYLCFEACILCFCELRRDCELTVTCIRSKNLHWPVLTCVLLAVYYNAQYIHYANALRTLTLSCHSNELLGPFVLVPFSCFLVLWVTYFPYLSISVLFPILSLVKLNSLQMPIYNQKAWGIDNNARKSKAQWTKNRQTWSI